MSKRQTIYEKKIISIAFLQVLNEYGVNWELEADDIKEKYT